MRRFKAFPRVLRGLALLVSAGLAACTYGGQGQAEVREVQGFDSVSLDTSGELIVTQGEREELQIVAGASVLPSLVTEVRDGMLFIGRKGAGPAFRAPQFRLTMRRVAALETHSSGRITARGLSAESLRIQISSSGGITLEELAAGSLEVLITSSGSCSVAGTGEEQTVRLSSSGSYRARDLQSRTAKVRVCSSGDATVRVSDSLEAEVTSSGSVRFYGSPQVDGNVTSSGRLVRLGD